MYKSYYYQDASIPDLNECAINNGGCSQLCNNTFGSFICDCFVGYELDGDQSTCNGKAHVVGTNLRSIITFCCHLWQTSMSVS